MNDVLRNVLLDGGEAAAAAWAVWIARHPLARHVLAAAESMGRDRFNEMFDAMLANAILGVPILEFMDVSPTRH
jgi:NaMN:DMB phosphoribosyltransferase